MRGGLERGWGWSSYPRGGREGGERKRERESAKYST
jgi:hypothetical protein